MSPNLKPLRIAALTIATLMAAYQSFVYWGVIVLGNRIKSPTEFFLISVPSMAFLAALIAWWKSRIGASLIALVILIYLGAVVVVSMPHMSAAATMILPPLWPFVIVGLLLVLAASFDRSNAIGKNQ